MKTTATFSVILVFFLFSTATATKEAVPVLDSDGDPLRTGVPYYVRFIITSGGGLSPRLSQQTCPEIVVQDSRWDDGIPVTFSNVDPNDDIVRESSDVNIEFVPMRTRLCPTTSVWKVDDSTGKWWVTTGGVKGNPGPNTLTSWFKIERTPIGLPSYKFRFCPSVCDSCTTMCKDIKREFSEQDGHMRLALTESETSSEAWIFLKANRTIIKQVV